MPDVVAKASVPVLPGVLLGARCVWPVSFLDENGQAIDCTGSTIAVRVDANNQNFDPSITGTLSATPTVAPQVSITFGTTDYGSLTAPCQLRVYVTATVSGNIIASTQFVQPIDVATDDQTATTDLDEVCVAVFGYAHTSLSATDQASANEAMRSAMQRVGQWSGPLGLLTANGLPEVWREWLRIEAELTLARSRRPERWPELLKLRDDAQRLAMTSFTDTPISGGRLTGLSKTILDIRRYVTAACVRQAKPVYPLPRMIDAAAESVITEFWNSGAWSFRRRAIQVYINPISVTGGSWTESTKTLSGIDTTDYPTHVAGTILRVTGGTNAFLGDFLIASRPGATSLTLQSSLSKTAGNLSGADIAGTIMAVTVAGLGTGETLDKISSIGLWGTDGPAARWATPDEYARFMRVSNTGAWAEPYLFRFDEHGSFRSWKFCPIPPEATTFHGQGLILGPSMPTGADAATQDAFAVIPDRCWPYIREKTLYALLGTTGTDGFARRKALDDMLGSLIAQFLDHGSPAQDKDLRDVYGDHMAFGASSTGGCGWGW